MKSFANNPFVHLSRTVWQHAGDRRRTILTFVGMFVVANVIWGLEPLMVGYFFNLVQTQGVNEGNIYLLLGLLSIFLLQEIIFWGLHGPARVLEMRTMFHVKANYRKYLLRGTMDLPIEWHVDHHSGDTIDKVEKGAAALGNFAENGFQILQAVTLLITAIGALLIYNTDAALIILGLAVPTFVVLAWFDKHLVLGYKRINAMENAISAKVFDTLSNVTTVIILRIEALVFRSIDAVIQKPYEQFDRTNQLNEWKWFTASIVGRIAVVIIIGTFFISQLEVGGVLIGTVYILYGYANQVRETFFRFAYLYNDVVRQRASVANSELLSQDFVAEAGAHQHFLPKTWKELSIEDLSFAYKVEEIPEEDGGPKKQKKKPLVHLSGISMTLKKGEHVALIGESGGGKSTYLKLLRDLYHPQSLTLKLDGMELPEGFKDISDSISLVPQDPEIFSTTIRENITLGVEYPESHLKVYTDMARFSEIVTRLPKGLESSVVEKGVNLSGGEKQRLALARGLLASQGKEIILLDEPTSSVDFDNELTIYKNIFESFPGKTVISSIHRLHLLPLFDTIYFFKRGKIIAQGSFDELQTTSPEFQKLWQKQLAAREALGLDA